MTFPAVPDDVPEESGFHLRPLPEYEPDDVARPPRRWSSLRPVRGPQLELASGGPGEPPVREVTLWMLIRRMLEVLDGRRPIGQLHSLLPGAAFEALLTRLRTTRPGTRHKLTRLRTCFPTIVAVEVTAVIEVTDPDGDTRVIAAAARFERDGDRWPCTALRLI